MNAILSIILVPAREENGKAGKRENGQGTNALGLVFPSSRFPVFFHNSRFNPFTHLTNPCS